MKKLILTFGIIASLASCKKESNFIYKYSYTTESSLKANRTVTSLSNYGEQLTPLQIESERILIRESKKSLLNENVIKDTLILTNY
mgnify:CR=1 FL=1|jgi:ABC-type uncharacterized transport system auxiliary subunit